MADYQLPYSGDQIKAAIGSALNPDQQATPGSQALITSGAVSASYSMFEEEINRKQDILTFDDAPTEDSTNPVTSGGVFSSQEALKQIMLATFPADTINDVSVASVPDGADDIPVKSLTANIDLVQNLNGYDRPWPAGGNVNKFGLNDVSAIANGTNKTLTVSGEKISVAATGAVASSRVVDSSAMAVAIDNSVLGAGTYYFKVFNFSSTVVGAADSGLRIAITTNGNTVEYAPGATIVLTESSTIAYIGYETTLQWNSGNTMTFFVVVSTEDITVFSPYSNICPINGWTGANVTRCGKNLFDKSTVVTGELNSTGGINTAATSIRTSAYIKVNPSTEYILYDICSTSSVSYCWAEYDGDKAFISAGTITGVNQKRLTTSATTSYLRVCILPANLDSCIVVQQHDINPAYSPYSGTVYPVSWESEAGTVYGGTLRDNGDGTWTLTKTMEEVDLGTLTYSYSSSAQKFYSVLAGVKEISSYAVANALCSQYPITSAINLNDSAYDKHCGTLNNEVQVKDLSYNSKAAFKTAMSGVQLVYELAATQTYTLTAESVKTLLGQNNLFADTGDVAELVYRADVGLYIAKKLGENA